MRIRIICISTQKRKSSHKLAHKVASLSVNSRKLKKGWRRRERELKIKENKSWITKQIINIEIIKI